MNRSVSVPASWRRLVLRVMFPLLALSMVATTGCVTTGTNPVSGNTRAYGYTWDEEVKLGTQADQQIQQQYGVYDDEQLQEYLDRVAQEVLAESHMRRASTDSKFRGTEFTFRILDSPIINAFALPGGYVYVTRGLMAHLNNEAQLAMVIGHEIAHVAARHASQQAARQQFTQGLLVAGAVAGQAALGGNAAQNVLGIGGQAAQVLSLSYSRDNERESDRLGVEYATLAGYEASEGAAFFTSLKRIQQQSGQSIPSWQSTHPDPGAREDKIVQMAREWQQRVSQPATAINQADYYRALEGIVMGENPRQGFERDDVFYHPELAFRFPVPQGWTVQNQPRQVAAIAPNQDAFLVFTFADADSPDAAAAQLVGQEGITVVDRSSRTVNGLNAERVVVEATTQQGQTIRLLAYFIAFDGEVYQFQGLTTAGKYADYRPSLEASMQGFQRLTDSSILTIEPTRMTIRPAGQQAPFRSFVNESALPDDLTAADLAIINQIDLETMVDADRPLKLPRP